MLYFITEKAIETHISRIQYTFFILSFSATKMRSIENFIYFTLVSFPMLLLLLLLHEISLLCKIKKFSFVISLFAIWKQKKMFKAQKMCGIFLPNQQKILNYLSLFLPFFMNYIVLMKEAEDLTI